MVRRKISPAVSDPSPEASLSDPELVETPQEAPKRATPPRPKVAKPRPSSPVTAPASPPTPPEPETPEPSVEEAVEISKPEPEDKPEKMLDRLAALPFIERLPRGYGQCEFVNDEPGRNANRVPYRPLNSATFYAKQCNRPAQLRLRSDPFTGTRSGFYCTEHLLAEIARSPLEQARLDQALSNGA